MSIENILWILLALALAAYGQYARSRRKADRSPTHADEPAENAPMPRRKGFRFPSQPPGRSAAPPAAGPIAFDQASIRSWGYQLQKLDVAHAARSPFDLLVIDYSKDGSDEEALTSAEVAALQKKPGGARRVVLSYLSIGEAESYRYYWNKSWKRAPPPWLLGENEEWAENYAVAFWDPGWQSLIFGSAQAYLDKIIDAGFDGVYLDKCDVFEDLLRKHKSVARSRRDIAGDMVELVARLSAHAKQRRPGFLVVMQNAETLLERRELMSAIDGVAKEELVFGQDAPEKRNPSGEFEESRDLLVKARDAGKLVLLVEYLNDKAKVADVSRIAGEQGFVLYVSAKDRELDRLSDPLQA